MIKGSATELPLPISPLVGMIDQLYCPSSDDEQKVLIRAEEVLVDKIIVLYFSASWCAPCS